MSVEPSKARESILARRGMRKITCRGLGTKRGVRGDWQSDFERAQKRATRGNGIDRTAIVFAREIMDSGKLPQIIGLIQPVKSTYGNNRYKLQVMFKATRVLLNLLDLEHARVLPIALAEGAVEKLEIGLRAIKECRKYENVTCGGKYKPPSPEWYSTQDAYLDRVAKSVRLAISLLQPRPRAGFSDGSFQPPSPPLKRGAGRPRLRTSERKRRRAATKRKTLRYAKSKGKKGKKGRGPRKL